MTPVFRLSESDIRAAICARVRELHPELCKGRIMQLVFVKPTGQNVIAAEVTLEEQPQHIPER